VAERLQRLVPREFAERLLATRGQIAGERRIVTMLFSDVKGSTPMAERLDPEEMLEIMDGAFDVLIEPITRYEGALARLMGDGILAFFGAPIAHEDDAERACRAALEILEGAQEYATRLEEERGIAGFNVRVGIHTGLVVVGEVGSDLRVEYTAMGDAVNTASRMEEAAEPGTVLITEDTHRLTAPLFETESLGPIEVRGKTEPVPVYRVLAPKAVVGKPRGIQGLESPLVGRDAEFQALRDVLERLQAGIGGIVTVVGEAGIGKSRLVAELRKEAGPLNVRWVEGRCLSYGESMAYLFWVDMLHGLLGVSAEDPPLAVREALRRFVNTLCPDHFDEVYTYLGRMMSLPLEDEIRERLRSLEPEGLKVLTFRAVERVLESAARETPLVLICEDLHWADASSLELLEQALGLTDRCSLLLMCAFRPYPEHGCWAMREVIARLYRHRHTDLWLQSLSATDSEMLVANLLHVEALPHPLRMRILDHAEGNPFYVEEVIRSLIDMGAIVQDESTGYWQAMRAVEDIAIPDTLQGVLMARIDRLQEEARRVLQLASVIGRIFLYRVLAAIAREEETLDVHLSTLLREDMIRERARVPELEYIFKHHLTQQAAYNGLLRSERHILHRQVAEALGRLFPGREEEQLGLLAHHWEQAGEREKAIEYLCRAGEQAAAQFANGEAVGYFSRALDLMPQEDLAGRYDLLLAREGVYAVQGAREAQRVDLRALQELAEALGGDARRCEVALRQAHHARWTGDYARAIARGQAAIRLAQYTQDMRGQAEGHLHWGRALYHQGHYEEATTQYQCALVLGRDAGLRKVVADSLWELGLPCSDPESSREYCEQALRIYREMGDRYGESRALFLLAGAAMGQGDLDESRAYAEETLHICRERGARQHEGWQFFRMGTVFHVLGDYGRARSYYERVLPIMRETNNPRGEGSTLAGLALLYCQLGDDEIAREYSQEALHIGQETTALPVQAYALTFLGHALVGVGRLCEAADALRQALALRRKLGEYHLAGEPLAALARVALEQGDLLQAQAYVEEILGYLEGHALWDAFLPGQPLRVYLTCYRVMQVVTPPWVKQEKRADMDSPKVRGGIKRGIFLIVVKV